MPTHPQRPRRVPADGHTLTPADIEELGLEEAPPDAGPSWQEIQERRRRDGEQ